MKLHAMDELRRMGVTKLAKGDDFPYALFVGKRCLRSEYFEIFVGLSTMIPMKMSRMIEQVSWLRESTTSYSLSGIF